MFFGISRIDEKSHENHALTDFDCSRTIWLLQVSLIFLQEQMPSTAAVISALASVLVGLHRSGVLDLIEDISQLTSEPGFLPAGRRPCRLCADETLSPLREVVLAQVLRPERYLEIALGAALFLASVGVLVILRAGVGCCRRCCRRRSVASVTLDFINGGQRQIARRGVKSLAR